MTLHLCPRCDDMAYATTGALNRHVAVDHDGRTLTHGTSWTYRRYGCRCDECRQAYAVAVRERKLGVVLDRPEGPTRDYDPMWWADDGACRGEGTDLFFQGEGGHYDPRARLLCASCPSRIPCLEYALDNHERFGIWGGLTPKERRAEKRRRRSRS